MKNINENINRVELNEEELLDVTGANWLTDAWDATCDWAKEHKNGLIHAGCIVGGIALCATGIGAGAAAGIFLVESVGAAGVVATGFGGMVGIGVGQAIIDAQND